MSNTRLIINADDFGYDSIVNRAILESFSKGLCSSTSIMANMPAFEEACTLCHENKLIDCVGLHLVLSEDAPLTDRIKKYPGICDDDGQFNNTRRKPFFNLSTEEKNVIAEEISAQIDHCRRFGLSLSHVDSHHHIHVEWGINGILLRIAKDKGLPYIRLSRHVDPDSTWFKNLYRRFLNYRIMLTGAAATKYFGTVDDYIQLSQKMNNNPNSFEIMIHPTYNNDQMLVDNISKESLDQYIAKVDGYKNAVSFSMIVKS